MEPIILPPCAGREYELGVTHDLENRGDERAVAFNVFLPGSFEAPFRDW